MKPFWSHTGALIIDLGANVHIAALSSTCQAQSPPCCRVSPRSCHNVPVTCLRRRLIYAAEDVPTQTQPSARSHRGPCRGGCLPGSLHTERFQTKPRLQKTHWRSDELLINRRVPGKRIQTQRYLQQRSVKRAANAQFDSETNRRFSAGSHRKQQDKQQQQQH